MLYSKCVYVFLFQIIEKFFVEIKLSKANMFVGVKQNAMSRRMFEIR